MPDPTTTDLLHAFVASRDVPCPRCGYNLRSLTGVNCPECGEPLVLRVGLVYPKMALMITGLIGIAAGMGLNGLLLIYAAIQIIFVRVMGSFVVPFLIYNALAFLVEAGLLTAWLLLWRRMQRLDAGVRFIVAVGCWLLTLTNIILFSIIH